MEREKLVFIAGPTAVGKTAISVLLAKRIGGEIISADSMQVYKGMDIGTAKINKDEMNGIKHYLIDELNPDDEFNVAIFQEKAREAVEQIQGNRHIPIIVGGTAFYIQAFLYGIDFTQEDHDNTYREELMKIGDENGGEERLYQRLVEVDPQYAKSVHMNNRKRVIRALEYYHFTGIPFSKYNEEQKKREAEYDFCYFVLIDDRDKIYERINERVERMLKEGLVEEVEELRNKGYGKNLVSMQGIGYKEIYSYLDGEITLDEAVYKIKRDTRHFAKRQLTWLRHEKDIILINKKDYDYDDEKILQIMIDKIKETV